MQMNGSFNANQYEPNQGGGANHPPALKIPFTITATAIVENKSKDGGFFQVDLTSQLGTQVQRYNIWNKEPKAVEIAHGQLSALCRATGRFQIDWANEGAALRGATGLMDVGYQKGEEPTAEKPNGGYTELKKVYDMAGNEPGKSGTAQQQPQVSQQAQPAAQNGQGWGNGQAQPNPSQQPPAGWQQPTQNAAPQQAQPQQQSGQAWQPGGAAPAGNSPPWANR